MKILLYFESEKLISKSGIGRALKHQKQALNSVGIRYTTNAWDDDYDILHINTVGINSPFIIKDARKNNKKVVYHAHSTEEDFRNSFILSNQVAPFFKKHLINLYSQADYIITPTPYSKKLLEAYGIDVPITPISNGIDMRRFQHSAQKIEDFRRYFSLKDTDKVILSVGLYFKRKGLIDFIEIARELPSYKFIWFGSTPKYAIQKDVRDALDNLPDNVILPGYVEGSIIEGAYMNAHCFFFPSYEETEGIVVLEALAAKQNIIVRDIGAFDPWLVHGKNCYKGHTNQEFKELLVQVVEKKLPDTSASGYETAQMRSIDSVGEQLKEVYEKVLLMESKEYVE